VWVKNADRFERRDVELGARNAVNVAITSGLKAGDQVRLGA
jgi:multidrug efflux pump subunit AcrA (membrane-fusion protein)